MRVRIEGEGQGEGQGQGQGEGQVRVRVRLWATVRVRGWNPSHWIVPVPLGDLQPSNYPVCVLTACTGASRPTCATNQW